MSESLNGCDNTPKRSTWLTVWSFIHSTCVGDWLPCTKYINSRINILWFHEITLFLNVIQLNFRSFSLLILKSQTHWRFFFITFIDSFAHDIKWRWFPYKKSFAQHLRYDKIWIWIVAQQFRSDAYLTTFKAKQKVFLCMKEKEIQRISVFLKCYKKCLSNKRPSLTNWMYQIDVMQ